MKILFTSHAKEKLKNKEAKTKGIDKNRIVRIIKEPSAIDRTLNPHKSMGELSQGLSLVVIWKEEKWYNKSNHILPSRER